ncbi:hypothetical protein [Paraburkholderia sacchari]|uniref:hypothetical protein n=1 Tax=Paraburkholderia sacchari TaxID=159450 RepID=UPI003D999E06
MPTRQDPIVRAIDIAEFASLINEARKTLKEALDLVNGKAKAKLVDDLLAEDRRLHDFIFRVEADFHAAAKGEYPEMLAPLFGGLDEDFPALQWVHNMEAKRT